MIYIWNQNSVISFQSKIVVVTTAIWKKFVKTSNLHNFFMCINDFFVRDFCRIFFVHNTSGIANVFGSTIIILCYYICMLMINGFDRLSTYVYLGNTNI